MKTKPDTTISLIMLLYCFAFISPGIINGFRLSLVGWCWVLVWILIAAFAAWKIESYEIDNDTLIKRNLLGLFARHRNLNALIRHSKEVINTAYTSNPLNIVRLFTKKRNYLVYREITLQFKDAPRLKIDERTVESSDFHKLYQQIKKYKTVKE